VYVLYVNNGVYRAPVYLLDSVQINTWYVARIVADDSGRGFYVEVFQEGNPSVRNGYTQYMPTGRTWRFVHWNYRGNAYLDDYREFNTTGMTWNGDERLTYTYDHLDRLMSVAPEAGATGYSQNYGYNEIGNLTTKSNLPGTLQYPAPARAACDRMR
jgi:hypothetical protein